MTRFTGLDPAVLADACALLGLDDAEVQQLHDDAELPLAVQVRIGRLLQRMVVMLEGRTATAPDSLAAFCASVQSGWGGQPFTARELLTWCESGHTRDSRDTLVAIRALCNAPGDVSPRQLGMALARLTSAIQTSASGLQFAGEIRGTSRWVVVRHLAD